MSLGERSRLVLSTSRTVEALIMVVLKKGSLSLRTKHVIFMASSTDTQKD